MFINSFRRWTGLARSAQGVALGTPGCPLHLQGHQAAWPRFEIPGTGLKVFRLKMVKEETCLSRVPLCPQSQPLTC